MQAPRLLLWQPVLSGDRHVPQFRRRRVAAGMGKGGPKETAGDRRARLAQGEVLEIAGYELARALAESIAARKLPGILERLQEPALAVLEVGTTEEPSAATMRMLEAPGLDTGSQRARAVVGAPFWTLQEITLAPALIAATEGLFRP